MIYLLPTSFNRQMKTSNENQTGALGWTLLVFEWFEFIGHIMHSGGADEGIQRLEIYICRKHNSKESDLERLKITW